MSARAKVVFPAPRSPERVTRSPGSSELAMSIASRVVACSSGSATEKLDVPDVVRSTGTTMLQRSRRRLLRAVVEREDAGDGSPAPHRGFERHRPAMQLDERAHQRKTQAGAAVAGAERMGLEPIEHLILYIGRNAGTAIRNREDERIFETLGRKRNGLTGGRKAYRIGEQIE